MKLETRTFGTIEYSEEDIISFDTGLYGFEEEKKFLLMQKIETSLKRLNRDFPIIKNIITVDGLRINFEYGWALVRASNTNPILVTKYEASSYATAKTYQNALEKLIQKEINELNITTN